MRPDADDFAAIVQANQFQLISEIGTVAAALQEKATPVDGYELRLYHHKTGIDDSRLEWSDNEVSPTENHYTAIRGPGDVANNARSFMRLAGSTIQDAESAQITATSSGTSSDCTAAASALAVTAQIAANGLAQFAKVVVAGDGTVDLRPSVGLELNGRAGYLLTAVADQRMTGGGVALTGVPSNLPNMTISTTLVAGDVYELSIQADFDISVAGALCVADFYVNGAAASNGPLFGTAVSRGTVTGTYISVAGFSGLHTFNIGVWNAGGGAATVQPFGRTAISARIYSKK